jgi:DNA polymerase III delta subunit
MLYLLHGSDDYSRSQYIHQLVSRTGLPRVDYSTENAPRSVDDLQVQDLFSGGQVIVLEGVAAKLLALDVIESLAKSANHIVFVETDLDRRTKVAKDLLADKRVQSQEFAVPGPEQLPKWVSERARELGAKIDDAATRFLLQRLGYIDPVGGLTMALREPSLLRLSQELSKLATYAADKSITVEMVRELVTDDRQVLTLSIADSLGRKNRKELYELLEGYYSDSGSEDETSRTLALVGLLADQFRSQLLVKDAVERRVPENQILSQTGWKSGRLFVVKRLAGNFTNQQLRDALSKLESLDIELKSTTTPPRVVLELILAQMV